MPGEFSWEDELDGGLDFAGGEGSPFVEPDEFGAFGGDSVEGVVDEGVHDVHGLFGNTDVGVDLLQHFVDVDGEGFDSPPSGLLVSFWLGFLLSHDSVMIIKWRGMGLKWEFYRWLESGNSDWTK